ncbi:MAG TPA: site-specific DNA-methyltransferase [Xanthomonadaceae bacterium]|nr:site-specific DNA-methyltransferase [Xanthomonadaceae bacterium]
MNRILHGDNLEVMHGLPAACVDLVYIDPPFNTGRRQTRTTLRTVRDEAGDRTGFKGQRYRSETLGTKAYGDAYDDYLGFLAPRLVELHRLLRDSGSLIVHLDPRESHYVKVYLDGLFGRENFQNEIIWAYDYGGRGKRSWPAKHDVLLWYSKNPVTYTFDFDAIDRVPYLAPGLVGPEKAARGKVPTDVWWHTIVSPTGKEKTGYPTQKPLGILERIVRVHSRQGDLVLDAFAGSGTTGLAAARHGRRFLLIDDNPEAIAVMRKRFEDLDVQFDDGVQHAVRPDLFA